MQSEIEYVSCPICDSSALQSLLQKNGWTIARCNTCRLAMVNPRRKNSTTIYQSDEYFSSDSFYYDYLGNKAAYQKGFRSKLKLICAHQPTRGRLLDVGAAYGFFMEEAAKCGFLPSGIELAPAAARHARNFGPVFTNPLTEIETGDRFSVVCFIDSLEHFEDPLAGLRKARELLEPEGIVAVMVPNIESTFARLTGSKWHLILPEEHLYYFTPRSIRLIMAKAGFEPLHVGTGGYGRSAAELLRVLLRGKVTLPKFLDSALRRIALEVNLGDIFCIARKI